MKEYHMEDRFIIDVTALTSEMIGRLILKKLATSKCLVIPFEDAEEVSP